MTKHSKRTNEITAQQQIRLEFVALFGTIDFDDDWDYKADRLLRDCVGEKSRMDIYRRSSDEQT